MSKNISISLGDFDEFVSAQIKSGQYASASDVLRAGLRLLREREEKLQALRDELQKGLDSGEPEPFDFEEFLEEMRADSDQNA